jgi:hypothetical protein
MDRSEYLTTQKLVATFMVASAPLEAYFQQGGELTEADLRSVELTSWDLCRFLKPGRERIHL